MEHLGRTLPSEEQSSGVDLGLAEQIELQGRNDTEVAAPAAQGPEQLRLGVGVDAVQRPIRDNELDRGDAVARQAVLSCIPAQSAAERVAGDADIGR